MLHQAAGIVIIDFRVEQVQDRVALGRVVPVIRASRRHIHPQRARLTQHRRVERIDVPEGYRGALADGRLKNQQVQEHCPTEYSFHRAGN